MTAIWFLAEWALRSSVLILGGALLLLALRVRDAGVRLAAWTAILCGSLAIPVLMAALPAVPVVVMRAAGQPVQVASEVHDAAPAVSAAVRPAVGVPRGFDWARAGLIAYVLIAGALLLRLGAGLALSLRVLRRSRATGRATEGIEIRESERVATPVTLGIVRPAIVLPGGWREWDGAKLEAVLAHERSHIRRRDPAVQAASAIHRALLWHSPLSWWLHRRIVRVAEEASDDAAVAVTHDRAFYAEVLLDFMRAATRGAHWQGVPMARYGRADARIHRILDETGLARGVTRWSLAAIVALAAPLAYLVAATEPQAAQPRQSSAVSASPAPAPSAAPQPAAAAVSPEQAPDYLVSLGNVTAYTVTVKPRIDGQLMSVNFNEGDTVQAGQLLASIDPQRYQIQLTQAEGQLTRDQAALQNARIELDRYEKLAAQTDSQRSAVVRLEDNVRSDEVTIENAKLQLSYAQVRAPITGVTGLRLVDPGNIVHASDDTGIVVINQIQPIAVMFQIPEDMLPAALALLRRGAKPAVEVWNRTNTVKIATGRLTATDNQIDASTGTVKLKAEFDNKDGALFPGEFVNTRMSLSGK